MAEPRASSDPRPSEAYSPGPRVFELRNLRLDVLRFTPLSEDLSRLGAALDETLRGRSDFFEGSTVLLDLSHWPADGLLEVSTAHLERLRAFLALLARVQIKPLAACGEEAWRMAVQSCALAWQPLPSGRVRAVSEVTAGLSPASGASVPVASPTLQATQPQSSPTGDVRSPTGGHVFTLPALIVEKNLRGGQRIYASGRDLVVLGDVSETAEVIADGHIHLYGTLRGRALAGASGWREARIFCRDLRAELLSIAGVYRSVDDTLLPITLRGQAVQVLLEGDRLILRSMG